MPYTFNVFTGKLDKIIKDVWTKITGGIQYLAGKVIIGGNDSATEALAVEDDMAVYKAVNTYDDATGGTIAHTEIDGTTYTIHTFSSSGTFVNNKSRDVEYLVVGGGGAGGTYYGGGGGGGGVKTGTLSSLSSGNKAVTVGDGGSHPVADGNGDSGDDSVFDDGGSIEIIAHGGGGGGGGGGTGSAGGSGGGGSGNGGENWISGGAGTGGEGYEGGDGFYGNGGGGGGAGEVGENADTTFVDPPTGGTGGDGFSCDITGTPTYYGGGGGGDRNSYTGQPLSSGGLGGGGTGGDGQYTSGTDGEDEKGGGGGGGYYASYGLFGGAGGSGVVIIRYLTEFTTGYSKSFYVDDDGNTLIGDSENGNYTNIADNGFISLFGEAQGVLTLRPNLVDKQTKVSDNKPTEISRGCNVGYSFPIFNSDDEELYFRMRIPARWDGTTDPQFGIMCTITGAEDVGDKFKFQLEWQTTPCGGDTVMGTSTSNCVSEQTIITGGAAANTAYCIWFTLNADDATNPIEAGDMLQGRLRRIAASANEVSNEIAVWDWAVMWKTSKVFGTYSVETNVT